MIRRFSGWRLVVTIAGLGAFLGLGGNGLAQDAAERSLLRLVADVSGNQARLIAIGVSSLANQKIEAFDIDIAWAGFQDDSLDLIQEDDNDFGLIDLNQVDLAKLEAHTDLRAVMKYWPFDDSAESEVQQPADARSGYLLIAKPSVKPELVQELVAAIQADNIFLKVANIDVEKLTRPIAMVDLPLPLHQGVQDYLKTTGSRFATVSPSNVEATDPDEAGVEETETVTADISREDGESRPNETAISPIPIAAEPTRTPIPKTAMNSRSYTLYFDTNEAELDRGDFQSVAKACQYAATLPRAKFVISGHTDTVGSESSNNVLAGRRAVEVANAIRNDPRFREALNVVEFGESNLAVETADGVPELLNRRVMITILPGQ